VDVKNNKKEIKGKIYRRWREDVVVKELKELGVAMVVGHEIEGDPWKWNQHCPLCCDSGRGRRRRQRDRNVWVKSSCWRNREIERSKAREEDFCGCRRTVVWPELIDDVVFRVSTFFRRRPLGLPKIQHFRHTTTTTVGRNLFLALLYLLIVDFFNNLLYGRNCPIWIRFYLSVGFPNHGIMYWEFGSVKSNFHLGVLLILFLSVYKTGQFGCWINWLRCWNNCSFNVSNFCEIRKIMIFYRDVFSSLL